MPRVLKDIQIQEVSSVDKGAGRGVKVMLMKRDDDAAEYWKREFSQEERDAAASSGAALPDGSFPIKSEQDLKNAIQAVGRAKDPAKAKAHIKSRARSLGRSDLIPDTWKRDGSGDIEMTKEELDAVIAKAVGDAVKGVDEKNQAELAKRDFAIAVLKMSDAHQSYMNDADMDDEAKKKFTAMSADQRDAHMQKNPLKKREAPVTADDIAKRDAQITAQAATIAEMKKRLDAADLEKSVADFKKRAIDAGLTEADGEVMRKAYGGDPEAQKALEKRQAEVTAALKKQVETGALFKEFGHTIPVAGSPLAELNAKADELRKADPKLTKEQAFTKAYEDPANAELVGRYKDGEMRKRLSLVA